MSNPCIRHYPFLYHRNSWHLGVHVCLWVHYIQCIYCIWFLFYFFCAACLTSGTWCTHIKLIVNRFYHMISFMFELHWFGLSQLYILTPWVSAAPVMQWWLDVRCMGFFFLQPIRLTSTHQKSRSTPVNFSLMQFTQHIKVLNNLLCDKSLHL
jgi:hypothetical protein